MNITPFDLAQRFIGVKEAPGATAANPLILGMLKLDQTWPTDDEVAWCSAFVNFIVWLLRLPRSKSLGARSWLGVGRAIPISSAQIGFDVVILSRGEGAQPGPDVINASGHVGFFAGIDEGMVHLLGGNQSNSVSIASFPTSRILGVRRLI